MKILVAEDEPMLLKTIELKLKKEGYEVITTADGREAVAKIEETDPDLVITDIMMPYVSGLEIVSIVRKKTNKRIPIIMLSAMEQEKVVMEAFELGADDYITKPFSLNELVIRVKRLTTQFARNNPG
jgi:DNA-binding response OmpR family regulator